MSETVVLLHGIFLSARWMRGIERFLKRQGYQVLNLNYASTRYPLETLVEQLHEKLAPHIPHAARVHFVGHSMGGLLIRAYLAKYPPTNLGRVVMLGTPNHGSEVADFLKDWKLYRWLYGPAGQQLITDAPRTDKLPPCELGIIAGSRNLDPIFGRLLPKPHDGKVAVASTKLDGMRDHCVLPISHTQMLVSAAARREILAFLQHGKFSA